LRVIWSKSILALVTEGIGLAIKVSGEMVSGEMENLKVVMRGLLHNRTVGMREKAC
jgi:hypothetical protein